MKKFGAIGCSHTSINWGDSWPIHLGRKIDHKPVFAYSQGAGNSMFVEKTRKLLETNIKFLVIQLTEPSRITTGFRQWDKGSENYDINDPMNDGCYFENLGYYTWNNFNNEQLFKKLGYDTRIDKLWQKEISSSDWCYLNTVHSILSIQYLCESKNIPVIFYSWFLPFDKIIPHQYNWLYEKANLLPNFAKNYLDQQKITPLSDGHYGSEAHKSLVDGWLYRHIVDIVL